MKLYSKLTLISQLTLIIFFITLSVDVWPYKQDSRASELDYSNKKLNLIYKKILSNIPESTLITLKKAQRQWIIFRNLDCKWAYSAEQLDCMIDRTENRTKELEETYFFDQNGNYKSISN